MLIRKANIRDVPQVRVLITEFFERVLNNSDITYDPFCATALAEGIIKDHFMLVIEEEKRIVGGLGGLIEPLQMNRRIKVFQEVFFYVKPTFRGYTHRLIGELEAACKYQGIDLIVMAHLSDKNHEKMDRFYFTRGYKLLEKHYYRRIDYGR